MFELVNTKNIPKMKNIVLNEDNPLRDSRMTRKLAEMDSRMIPVVLA